MAAWKVRSHRLVPAVGRGRSVLKEQGLQGRPVDKKTVESDLVVLLPLLLIPTATNATQPIHMVYVPSHLYHMLFELFKVRRLPFSGEAGQGQPLVFSFSSAFSFSWLLSVHPSFFPQNAMRATVESHESSLTLPPIKILVALGEEDLSIKVGGP